jgi:hypothetical protein
MDQEKKLILVTWDFSEVAEKAVKHAIRIYCPVPRHQT